MQPAPDLQPTPARLTWPEIRDRYPDQWVVLVDLDYVDEVNHEIRTAVVAGAAPTRRGSFASASGVPSKNNHFAHRFTGRVVPPGFVSMRLFGL